MGFLKDMRAVGQMGKDMQAATGGPKNTSEMMANAQQQMANAQQIMARAQQAAQVAMTGVDATATVVSMQQVAQMGYDPVIEFEVTIMREGGAPYPASVQQQVPQMRFPAVSQKTSLAAKVDQNDPSLIWLNVISD